MGEPERVASVGVAVSPDVRSLEAPGARTSELQVFLVSPDAQLLELLDAQFSVLAARALPDAQVAEPVLAGRRAFQVDRAFRARPVFRAGRHVRAARAFRVERVYPARLAQVRLLHVHLQYQACPIDRVSVDRSFADCSR